MWGSGPSAGPGGAWPRGGGGGDGGVKCNRGYIINVHKENGNGNDRVSSKPKTDLPLNICFLCSLET